MRTIIKNNSKVHYNDTGSKIRNYKVIEEYKRYYLCEYIQNGKPIYKECFLKVEVDDVKEIERTMDPRVGWHM